MLRQSYWNSNAPLLWNQTIPQKMHHVFWVQRRNSVAQWNDTASFSCIPSNFSWTFCLWTWKQRPLRPLRPPKTSKLENKDPPYFSGLRNYDQSVASTTVSWALVTRILRLLLGPFSVLNWHLRNWFRFKSKNFVFYSKQGTYPLSLRSF